MGAFGLRNPEVIPDDFILQVGTNWGTKIVNRSASLAADAELAAVIVGTSNHKGVAANSLILSNTISDGDVLLLINDGGNSKEYLSVDGDTATMSVGHGMAILNLLSASGDIIITPGSQTRTGATFVVRSDSLGVVLGAGDDAKIHYNGTNLVITPAGGLILSSVNAGVTADSGSAQGGQPITLVITQISVCASAGDAVTLPTAAAGMVVIVMNDGAESADVFPASSDDINEAGANAAYALPANKNAMFVAHDTTNWSTILSA